jgi:hypothetical protein
MGGRRAANGLRIEASQASLRADEGSATGEGAGRGWDRAASGTARGVTASGHLSGGALGDAGRSPERQRREWRVRTDDCATFVGPLRSPRRRRCRVGEGVGSWAIAMVARDWIALAQVVVIVVGGGWALYKYRLSRQGHPTVAIEHSVRFVSTSKEPPILIVSLRVRNARRVLFYYESATATLMDASTRTADGAVRLLPFAQQDPFLSVYGRETTDANAVSEGQLFRLESDQIPLEPGEAVDVELAYPLTSLDFRLMAMRVRIQGRERRSRGDPFVWSSFFFIPPARPKTNSEGPDS